MALKYFKSLFLSSLLLLSSEALAGPQFKGFSAYAALNSKFPCGQLLRITKCSNRPAIAVLINTFGTDFACVNRFIQESYPKPHFIEFHLTNETCRWKGKCLKEEILHKASYKTINRLIEAKDPRFIDPFIERIELVLSSVEKTDQTRLAISLGLEDRYSTKAAKTLYHIARANWPYKIIRSPLLGGNWVGPMLEELHSEPFSFGNKAKCVYNPDGVELSHKRLSSDFNRFRSCFSRFLWTHASQGLTGPAWVHPFTRTFKVSDREVRFFCSILKQR